MTEKQIELGSILAAKKLIECERLQELKDCKAYLQNTRSNFFHIQVNDFMLLSLEVGREHFEKMLVDNITRCEAKIESLTQQIKSL